MPQNFFFDLVKPSTFYASSKPSFFYGSRPCLGNLGRVKLWCEIQNECFGCPLLCKSVESFLQHKFFTGTPQSTDFCFCQTISSTSSDSIMSFDSEGSEIYYIAEVGTEDQHRKLNWRMMSWFICQRPSSQQRMVSQIPGGGCWRWTQTNSVGQDSKAINMYKSKSDTSRNTAAYATCLLFSRLLWSHVNILL